MTRTIVLFDMDGTLTEARCSFDSKQLQQQLYNLSNAGSEIGIITGSDENYLREQMGVFLHNSPTRYKMHLLPCNGTKYFKPPESADEDYKLVSEVSMETFLGEKDYRTVVQELIYSQVDTSHYQVPLTGHFINCRGSMINWSPIGRNASKKQRKRFVEFDKETGFRTRILDELRAILKLRGLENKVTIKLGGDTSFDVYPKGWDKTYGLKHFAGWDVWFVGDRCFPNGNDYEIYQACMGQSYVSEGPEMTIEIIESITQNLRKK